MKIDWTYPSQGLCDYYRRKEIQRSVEALEHLERVGMHLELFPLYWERPEKDDHGRPLIQPRTAEYLSNIRWALHIGSGAVEELRAYCATDVEDDKQVKAFERNKKRADWWWRMKKRWWRMFGRKNGTKRRPC